jgi:hypothetical protein
LHFEPVRAGAGRATAEVESFQAHCNRSFHERPVYEHVGSFVAEVTKRRSPCHLEFITVTETQTTCDRLLARVRASDPTILRELIRDLRKKLKGLCRSSKIAHVTSENGKEWLELVTTE